MILSEDEILALLLEEKPITDGLSPSVTKMTSIQHHRRKGFSVTSKSGHMFVINIRQSELNALDFSVILGYEMPREFRTFRLRRYNGKSHRHTNTIENQTLDSFHIHTATERYQQRPGFKEDHFAEATNRYHSLETAITCLLDDCGFRVPFEETPLYKGTI
jgi:hypothetical protein